MKIPRLIRTLFYLFVLTGAPLTISQAATVRMTASGQFNFVSLGLASTFAAGDPFNFTVFLDTSAPDEFPSDTSIGIYDTALQSFAADLNGYGIWDTSGSIRINDGTTARSRDTFYISKTNPFNDGPVNGLSLTNFVIQLDDTTRSIFLGDSLAQINTGLDTSQFDLQSIGVEYDGRREYLTGAIQNISITAVPVPAAALLFGTGLLGLFTVSRRKAFRDQRRYATSFFNPWVRYAG